MRRAAQAAILAAVVGAVTTPAVSSRTQGDQSQQDQSQQNQSQPVQRDDPWLSPRREMVEQQIHERGVNQPEVLRAMESVPRHLFIPDESRDKAYGDAPLPIGWGQTISQPYIVALMTELLDLDRRDKVLEIGTGSGYHAAVLSKVAGQVFTIEIIDELGKQARGTLHQLGYQNVHVRVGDGYKGWPEEAPFDAIILTAAPPKIPQPLLDQLKVGGRMVVPVGSFVQDLLLITKTAQGIEKRTVAPVRFVPMTGEVQKNPG
jgi:protein-L-isoaspartate(D-aspartate) O-methyltransferase